MLEKIKSTLLLIIMTLSAGCEKNIKDGLVPEFEPKLVVMSFITPGDSVSYVNIMGNTPIFGEKHWIQDYGKITGYISDGNRKANFRTNQFGFYFNRNDIQVEAGKTYAIRVISDKGYEAEGITTVPDDYDFDIKVDTFTVTMTDHGYTRKVRKFNAEFSDQPGKENYYRIMAVQMTYYNYPGQGPHIAMQKINLEKNMFNETNMNTEGKITVSSNTNNDFYKSDSSLLKIFLINCDKSYYLYHKSLDNYSDNDNPFTEASPVYSNISGGLGIFTSYTIDSLIFRLK